MKNKRLNHTRVVREAESLFAEAMTRATGGKRRLRPGDIVRYYFHGRQNESDEEGETVLLSGHDRVELMRQREPSIYLQALGRWVFRKTLCIVPNDARMPRILQKIEAARTKSKAQELA